MKIKKNQKFNWWICIVIAILYKPAFIDEIATADLIWNIGRALVFLVVASKYVISLRSARIKVYLLYALILAACLLVSTIINSGSFSNYILTMGIFLAIIIFSDTELSKRPDEFITSAAIILGAYVLINFVTIVLFPNGFYVVANYIKINGITMIRDLVPCYFLGFRNVMFTTILPAIVLNIISWDISRKKINIFSLTVILAGISSFFILWSATSIMVSIIFIITYSVSKKIDNRTIINAIYFLCFIFFITIVIFRLQDALSFIIVNILHKDLTFTNRTGIWDNAIMLIKQNPVLGYGYMEHEFYVNAIGASHAHDYYLDVWMRGGVLALLAFLAMIKKCGSTLACSGKGSSQRALIAMLAALLFAFETESYLSSSYLFIFIPLSIYLLNYRVEA